MTGSKAILVERLRNAAARNQNDDEEEESETEDDLDTLTVSELEIPLRAFELKITGKKAALIEHLR